MVWDESCCSLLCGSFGLVLVLVFLLLHMFCGFGKTSALGFTHLLAAPVPARVPFRGHFFVAALACNLAWWAPG